MFNPIHNGFSSQQSRSTDAHSFASSFLNGFFADLKPQELPHLIFESRQVNDIAKCINNAQAVQHLTELNSVKNLGEIIGQVVMLTAARDENQRTIAHVAIERRDLVLLKLIITLDPSLIQAKATTGLSPLCLAALLGFTEAIEWLANPIKLGVEQKANVNDTTDERQTPLHKALIFGHAETARQLLAYGANRDALDKYNLTPSDWALYMLANGHNKQTGQPLQKDPLQFQKYQMLMLECCPARGILNLASINACLQNRFK